MPLITIINWDRKLDAQQSLTKIYFNRVQHRAKTLAIDWFSSN